MKQHWKNFNAVRRSTVGDFPPISYCCPEKTDSLPVDFTLLVWNIYKRLGGDIFDRDLYKRLIEEVVPDLHHIETGKFLNSRM